MALFRHHSRPQSHSDTLGRAGLVLSKALSDHTAVIFSCPRLLQYEDRLTLLIMNAGWRGRFIVSPDLKEWYSCAVKNITEISVSGVGI